MTSELSFQLSILKTSYANFDSIVVIYERISVDRYDQTLFWTVMLYVSMPEVSLAVTILHDFPLYFYHSPLADPGHIPIASNLENVPHDL